MFDFVHENKRVVQVILLLLILPFALWGINSYRQSGGEAVATIEGEDITQQELDAAMRQLPGVNPDNVQIKLALLDRIVSEKLLLSRARAAGLEPTSAQLREFIEGMGEVQTDGKFDRAKYAEWLKSQGMTSQTLEAALKKRIAYIQITDLYGQNGYTSGITVNNYTRAFEQQRVVSLATISPDTFLSQVKVDDTAVKKYYDENPAEFTTPERARVEYVIFSPEPLLAKTTVSAEEVKKYYEDHKSDYTSPEQRHVAHILIKLAPKAGEADRKAAREKAESVLAELKQSPANFAELAQKYSDDPGSRNKGGDLGLISRGTIPMKQFEDAVFGLKPGEFSNVVETAGGFHIIKLLEIKGGDTKPFDQVKADIATRIKEQKAGNEFAELAEKFKDIVYMQSDSLKPAAELVKAPVQQSGWLEKGRPGADPWTDKTLQQVFSEDVLKKKRNSDAIEFAQDNRRIAVRLLEYKPSGTQPYSEVADAIKKKLMRKQASELAAKQGQDMLAQLQRGEKANLKWVAGKDPVSHLMPAKNMDRWLEHLILQADVSKLPAYVGAENANGEYVIARVDSVKEPGQVDDPKKRATYTQFLRQAIGEEMLQAYMTDARKHASFKMRAFAPNGKSPQ